MSLVGGGDTCHWWEGADTCVTGGRGRYVSLVGGGDTCHWWEGAIRVTGGRGGDTCHWWERG